MERDLEKLDRRIGQAVHRGMVGPRGILTEASRKGRKVIRHHERVWQRQLLNGFEERLTETMGGERLYQIINTTRYARAHDKGATFDHPPPAESLLPWVTQHMYAFPGFTPEEAAHALSMDLWANGLDGIFFTEVMVRYLKQEGERDLQQYLRSEGL